LGLPPTIFRSYVGWSLAHRGKTTLVDQYGTNVAAFSALPGGHHRRVHNEFGRCLAGLCHAADMHPIVEPQNLFDDMVPAAVTDAYLAANAANPGRQDCLIPDLLIHDYPTASGTNQAPAVTVGLPSLPKPAICEIKGIHSLTQHYGKRMKDSAIPLHGPHDSHRGADHMASAVRKEYLKKIRALDYAYDPAHTAEPDMSNGQPRCKGAFERAYDSCFATGQVLPLVFGAFGEGNRELHTFLEVLAKASVNCPGMAHVIPPGASANASYSFALSEMRRVVGLTISRCNSSLKIQRLPYIARSANAARQRAALNTMTNRRYLSGCPIWYSRNFLDEQAFSAFHQF
jgi:hypothetical protein